ncbi:MAG: EAL domain-containing protein [bacterium]|nr:EAL domain-containing protein [bacterium]
MKKKVLLSLLSLLVFFAAGAAVSTIFIRDSTSELSHIVTLHQIEETRQSLVIDIRTIQSDLYGVDSEPGQGFVSDVRSLRDASDECLGCHHQPEVDRDLKEVRSLVDDYEIALNSYIGASGDRRRMESLRAEATLVGNQLIAVTERMASTAGERLEPMTSKALAVANEVQNTILGSLLVATIFGIVGAVWLTNAVTRPVARLVEATGRIREGKLGYTLSDVGGAEFGKLARDFNAMSKALKKNYEELQHEVAERRQAEAELRKSEEALRASHERYQLAAWGANDGLWDWDLAGGRFYVSERWKEMLGIPDEEPGDDPENWFSRVHPEDVERLRQDISAHVRGETPHLQNEYRIAHHDGSWRWMMSRGLAIREPSGRAYRMAGSQTDVTQRKTYEQQLLHHAHHDPLTGLPNRLLLRDRLKQLEARARRHRDYLFGVLFLDLDRFKVINDTLGHEFGDQFLVAVSERLKGSVRTEDTIGRIGGDQFVIVLDGIDNPHAALRAGERIQSALAEPFFVAEEEVSTEASIGVVLSSAGFDEAEDLLRYADIAMYRAKGGGDGKIVVFDRGTDALTIRRLELEARLRKAVENEELRLHYQPILALDSDRIAGLEALVRWQHPDRGLLYPKSFLLLAENTGLIVSIGLWVLREAFLGMRSLQKRLASHAPEFISVNLSSRQLADADLVPQIEAALAESGLDPRCLKLELTETALVENTATAATMLIELQALGVQVCLDDFGTGYSSLGYLDRFPINTLKIDRSFVRQMKDRGKAPEIVRAIVSLAKKLEIDVVAEGVESVQQLEQTRDLKCEYAQGYLISKPLAIDEIEALITARDRGERAAPATPATPMPLATSGARG